ncbi:MAG: TIGR03960 family B12-binding radical SAM protein [Treponema sp.]|jgi:radical SAM family uncharacterized protein|nr:TIGR03960 family B12-binding radical SAM protein [Treponema sp.]
MTYYIDPLRDLGKHLLEVEKPSRYVGGEYGRLAKREALLRMLIAFPDLYEIGMSNQALRIIYNGLNQLEGVSCDRAFAPAPDFERLLREQGIPLYGLDTGISLGDLDVLLFTLGYELGSTGVLTMLAAASIPLHPAARTDRHPIVMMGGPCVSNPLPYSRFIDAFWIGEAEGGFFDLTKQLVALKQAGAGRATLLDLVVSHPSVWVPGKARVKRAMDTHFASREASAAVYPVPSMKVVQHHGAVEIMRGCPNGCRFCHAGYWYRPMRQKSAATIQQEVASFITQGGYREISLSSLSTGDFSHLNALVDSLNQTYAAQHISFQLPSLRVSTFSLPLLKKISEVRKSGLTFAVETPVDAWQLAINKEVSRDTVSAILQEARKYGWRGAKFYFMIGLPVGLDTVTTEEVEIVNFILEIARRTGMHFNINVGTFVPKPHTPYQWVAQINEATARKKLEYIRLKLKSLGHKVGIQDPFVSIIEGLISRGNEQVGEIIEEAYAKGCRLDAWSEFLQKDIWHSLLETATPLVQKITGAQSPDSPVPWHTIDPGISSSYLKKEFFKSESGAVTVPCTVPSQEEPCAHPCGICDTNNKIIENSIQPGNPETGTPAPAAGETDPPRTWRILFSFTKKGSVVFQPHLALVELFSMALTRAGIPVSYSQGFNPLPRMEIAAPLSIGIDAAAEMAALDTDIFFDSTTFKHRINAELPEGIRIGEAINIAIPLGVKKHSLSSLLWGYSYENKDSSDIGVDYVKAADEKKYRLSRIGPEESVFGLKRLSVLAKHPHDPEQGESYFTVYRDIYRNHHIE